MGVFATACLSDPPRRSGWPVRIVVSLLLTLVAMWLAVVAAEPLLKALSPPDADINQPRLYMYEDPWVSWRFSNAWDTIGARLWMGLVPLAVVFVASVRYLRGKALSWVGRILGWLVLLVVLNEVVLTDIVPGLNPPERRAMGGAWDLRSPSVRIVEILGSMGMLALWLMGRELTVSARNSRRVGIMAAAWVVATSANVMDAVVTCGGVDTFGLALWGGISAAALASGALTALAYPARQAAPAPPSP